MQATLHLASGGVTGGDSLNDFAAYSYTLNFHPQAPHLSELPEATLEHGLHSFSATFVESSDAPQWQSNVPSTSGQSMSVMPIKGFPLVLQ